jgi:L-Ala-D/L-Glu epimerase / N-acetyl-D-glutamate racemase
MIARTLKFDIAEEVWPMEKPFRISRGTRTEARLIVVTVTDGQNRGRGEAVPSRRYGETSASAIAQLEGAFPKIVNRHQVQELLRPGAARNALDCALWDFEAKTAGKRLWELAHVRVTDAVETAFTISLDTPQHMAAAAQAHRTAPVLKLKLGGDKLDRARVEAVRHETPARLLIDANESWSPAHYREIVPDLIPLGVELIEQPFPADSDAALQTLEHPIPVCADESCHTRADLPRLSGRYEAVNVKLDKTGGLTEALDLFEAARQSGFKILTGCMVCTSLGIAPARLLASAADYVDLDGPLLLAHDRPNGLEFENGRIGLPSPTLWG